MLRFMMTVLILKILRILRRPTDARIGFPSWPPKMSSIGMVDTTSMTKVMLKKYLSKMISKSMISSPVAVSMIAVLNRMMMSVMNIRSMNESSVRISALLKKSGSNDRPTGIVMDWYIENTMITRSQANLTLPWALTIVNGV